MCAKKVPMDLRYVEEIEKENEELRSKLAVTQELLEESRKCFAGRRYHIIVETSTDIRRSSVLHINHVNTKKSTVLRSVLIKIMKMFENPSEINEILIECERSYTDVTLVEWRWKAFKKESKWLCESFMIRGVEKIILPIETDQIPDLTQRMKETI